MSIAAQQQPTGAVDRIPPHNLEAEMGVIGSVLVDREMMAVVGEIVRPSDFYAHVHETIFGALQSLFDRGEPMDKIALAEELRRRDALERVGGLPYINTLMDTVQTAASAAYYAKIVREKAILRSLIHAGTEIGKLGYEAEEDVEEALDRSQQMLYEIAVNPSGRDFIRVKDLLKPVFDEIDRRFHLHGERTGLTAGFHDIDDMTGGFQSGNLVLVAARPGMGKTSFALNMAVSAAREIAEPVAFFSLEMSNNELIQRLVCAAAHLSMHDLRRGNIKEHQWSKIADAMSDLNSLPIYLDDTGALTVSEVRTRCRRLKMTAGLGAIFIDYMQLVRPGAFSRNANRNEELSEICRTLKVTAKDLDVPIIACAQLNRGVEARNDKRPMLSDLRDCLAGDALLTNADTGERMAIRDVVEQRLRFNAWTVDGRLKLVKRPIIDAWAVEEKDLFQVTTRSGRTIRCSSGHQFLGVGGWLELGELRVGEQIAVPRSYGAPQWRARTITANQALLLGWLIGDGHLGGSAALTVASAEEAELAVSLARAEFGLDPVVKPERIGTRALRVVMTTGKLCGAGKNPLTTWLRELGVWKKTAAKKTVPGSIYSQSDEVVAAFLRGLFHASGSISGKGEAKSSKTIRLSTISESLARAVQHLLLRLNLAARVTVDERHIGGYRTKTARLWTVILTDRAQVVRFMDVIGFMGEKHEGAIAGLIREKLNDAGHVNRLPLVVNELVSELRRGYKYSHAKVGWRDQGKAMSRATCVALAERLNDEESALLPQSDVLWDEILSIEPAGREMTYDITVGELHNFCVDDFITHNSGSLEQESDVVAFLYRDGYYHPEGADPTLTEFIIAKHRNGPTGTVRLRFEKEFTLFVPYADESRYPAP
jgi:replicative DNA helicase